MKGLVNLFGKGGYSINKFLMRVLFFSAASMAVLLASVNGVNLSITEDFENADEIMLATNLSSAEEEF